MNTIYMKGLTAAALIGGIAWSSTSDVVARRAEPAAAQPQLSFKARTERCAVDATPADTLEIVEKMAGGANDKKGVITVPVYWHVVTTNGGGANVSPLIPAQMAVLSDAFAGSQIAFELKGIDVTPNSDWFYSALGSSQEVAMKAALRKGGPEALNIYTTNGDVYLGWATLPFFYKFGPGYDGVVLYWAALPNTGFEVPFPGEPDGMLTYDQGDTGTHEVGHWLGLEHTFGPANGCTRPGDKIKDTPTEAEPQFLCIARDSCVGANNPGDDPITNFMDYVDDVCMDNFTADQTKRMRKHWHAFRDKKTRE
jgi:hypothetical protein